MEEVNKFYPKVRRTGSSLAVTIPQYLVERLDINEGTRLKVWFAIERESVIMEKEKDEEYK